MPAKKSISTTFFLVFVIGVLFAQSGILMAESVTMIFIPGGEYEMGDHYSEVSGAPRHMVYISPFYISKYEITNQQYCIFLNNADVKVVGSTVYAASDSSNSEPYFDTGTISYSNQVFTVLPKDGYDMSDHPVLYVSWYGADAYCNYYGYRLPTEAEWEYAARGGQYSPYYRYPWGNDIDGSNANYSSSGDPYEAGASPHTTPVGYYSPNGYGLYDMAGNLKEWCSDWFSPSYYDISPYDNPTGPANGSVRVVRGGAWTGGTDSCLVAIRDSTTPSNRNVHYGFRVVYGLSGPSGSPPSEDVHNGDRTDMMGFSDDPVNTATGNFFHSETDFTISTRGIPLEFSRHYNSKSAYDGPLGIGWTYSYNVKLTEDVNLVAVRWGDGSTDYWNPGGLGGHEPNLPGLYDSLSKDGSDWIVTKKNLDSYTFNSAGLLTGISDKNGNMITLAYAHGSDPNLVTQITEPAGGIITLAYNAGNLLESITDFASSARTVQYSYTNGRLTQVTDVLGNTIDYTYDASGYLETITDQRAIITVANVYDANGRVIQQTDGNSNISTFAYDTPDIDKTSITDPNGKVTIHTHFTDYKLLQSVQNPLGDSVGYLYDAQGNRAVITDRNGSSTIFEYDDRGNVTKTTNPDGGATHVEYNDVNFPDLPTKKTDALSNIITWEYDLKGNVTRQVDPNGFERTWTYNSFGQKLTETDENGSTTSYTYDSGGLLTQVTDPNGNNIWFGYDGLYRLTHVTDGRGSFAGDADHTAVTAYDNADRLISVSGPITSQSYHYDETGNRTNLTNGRGFTTTYQYDNNNNLVRVEKPAPASQTQVVQYSYDELNRKTSLTDPNGNVTTYEYDSAGRLIKEINPEAYETTYTYDAHGNVLSVTDGSGVTVSYEYDSMHRKVKQIDVLGNNWQWEYDKLGNLTKHIDAMGNVTKYEYDSLNRLVSVVDDMNNATAYEYDAVGNLTQVKDAGGRIISKKYYDEAGRLIRQEDGLGNAWQYLYDGAGNLASKIRLWSKRYFGDFDSNGDVTVSDLAVFAEAWLQDMSIADIAPGTGDGKSNFVDYSKFSQYWLENIEQEIEEYTISYVYDNENRLIEIHYPDSSQVVYSYDDNGNLVGMTDSTGTSTYVYDELDRLISSADSYGKTVQYNYDIVGNRTSITYPADSVNPARTVNYSYDSANRLDKITDWSARVWDYTVDGAGRITELVYPNWTKKLHEYDAAGRLASLGYKSPIFNNDIITYEYTRDAQGNPIKIDETGTLQANRFAFESTAYSYDNDNRLISTDTPVSYLYNNIGNVISRTKDGATTDFAYDFENSLISQSTDGSIVQHIYDGRGNRISRNENGTETRYVLDHGRDMSHVLCETDDAGDITAYYIHGPEIVGRVGADGSQRFYHTNHLGSVVALTDETLVIGNEAEAITDKYAYTPFGVPAGKECYVAAVANPFTYVGGFGVMAEADGLYFMRARFYEASSGRFYGKDPVEGSLMEPMSLHRYNYANSNAIVYVDPDGKIVVSAAIVGIVILYDTIAGIHNAYYTIENPDLYESKTLAINAAGGKLINLAGNKVPGIGGVINAVIDETAGLRQPQNENWWLTSNSVTYAITRSYLQFMEYIGGRLSKAYRNRENNRGVNVPSHNNTNTNVQGESYKIQCFGK